MVLGALVESVAGWQGGVTMENKVLVSMEMLFWSYWYFVDVKISFFFFSEQFLHIFFLKQDGEMNY